MISYVQCHYRYVQACIHSFAGQGKSTQDKNATLRNSALTQYVCTEQLKRQQRPESKFWMPSIYDAIQVVLNNTQRTVKSRENGKTKHIQTQRDTIETSGGAKNYRDSLAVPCEVLYLYSTNNYAKFIIVDY